MHTVWTGARVRLRPFKNETEWLELYEAENLQANEHWGVAWSARQQRKQDFEPGGLLSTTGGANVFAIERVDTGELVGYELHNAGSPCFLSGSVGTFILPEHEHRGFGIEAKQLCYCYLFENYPVLSVAATTLSSHKRAARGLLASGMRFAGRIKAFHYRDGAFHDMVWYRITREQWRQHPIHNVVRRG